MPATSVIVLAYGTEALLADCVDAVLANTGPEVELVLVDNGAEAAVGRLATDPRLRILRPGTNLGYAGGCNLGAAEAHGTNLVFLNSDAIVVGEAVPRLVHALAEDAVGLATGSVRLAAAPDTMNSVGNPVHFLGVVWAGGYGEPAADHAVPGPVASASGAFFGVRREVWDALGGFSVDYFAYHEDTELSLRAWQRGWQVSYVPAAVVLHHYEFARTPTKQYLLERNRWLTVLTVYPGRLIRLVLPALLAFELALCVLAAVQGWLPDKLRGWRWLLGHRKQIAARRRAVQHQSRISTIEFAELLSARIEPAMIERPPGSAVLNAVLATYWAFVLKRLSDRPVGHR
ncbi:MAG: glycosyltransferase family 2 protein [Actinomycetota bacterium]|nr:glycosyltransferase family 2 protein [Actinomycetota bacterium]MDQ2957988.1 glycosyltransferase family 2 protein [Actinomycetota bacterium]